MDLLDEINKAIAELDASIRSLRYTGHDNAESERDYRLALSNEIVKLELEGRPVTNIYNIARGRQHVAEAKYRQLKSEAIYRANLEAIQATKLKIRVLMAQYDKEYGANLSD